MIIRECNPSMLTDCDECDQPCLIVGAVIVKVGKQDSLIICKPCAHVLGNRLVKA